MKSIKKWSTALCIAATLILIQGCYKEDLSDCGVGIRFRYDKNIDETDKFAEEVTKINLYIFDSKGLFIKEYSEEGDALKQSNYIMNVDIKPGKYTFVAWGNKTDDYITGNFVKGVTKFTDAMLSLNRQLNIVKDYPAKLFYGTLSQIDVKFSDKGKQAETVELINNTNKIRVIKTGLALPTNADPASGTSFSCTITSKNGDYKFDNNYATTEQLKYLAQYSIDEGRLISEFMILRELIDGSSGSRLIVTYQRPDGTTEEIVNEPLAPIMVHVSKTKNLDIDEFYEIELEFNYTHGNATVKIADWKEIPITGGGGGILG